MRRLLGSALVAMLAATPAAAIPVTFVSGEWQDPTPPEGTNLTIDNSSNPSEIRWGATSGQQSGYDFLAEDTPFDAPIGSVFLIGTFTHLNFPIAAPFLTSVDLAYDMTIDGSIDISDVFSFQHTETPNDGAPCAEGGPTPCRDRVDVGSTGSFTPFTIDGQQYIFELMGFSTDGGATTSSTFFTQEFQENDAGLYGQITAVTVPEPVTMLLLGTGLALAAARRRGRRE